MLVDDHTLFRRGVKRLLEDTGDFDVIGEAANARSAVQLVRDLSPDVVVMDLQMPGASGVVATEQIIAANPDARVIVLTISSDQTDVTDVLVAGASGYVLKDSPAEEIIAAVRAVASGESSISPALTGELVSRIRTAEVLRRALPADEFALTEREVGILKLLAQGKDNKSIANELFISPKTVKNHVASILEKIGAENRIQAAVFAVRNGFI